MVIDGTFVMIILISSSRVHSEAIVYQTLKANRNRPKHIHEKPMHWKEKLKTHVQSRPRW